MDPINLQLTDWIFEASRDPAQWAPTLTALNDAVDGDLCMLASYDLLSGKGTYFQGVGVSGSGAAAYEKRSTRLGYWLQRDPAFAVAPAVVVGGGDLPEAELANSDLHRDWLAPQGLAHHVFLVLDRREEGALVIIVSRGPKKGAFSDEAIARLRAMLPRLHAEYREGQDVRQGDALQQVGLGVLDALPCGVIVVGANGSIVSSNRLARTVIAEGDVLSATTGGLMLDIGGRRTRIRDMLTRGRLTRPANQSPSPMPLSVERPNGRRPLSVLVVPLTEEVGLFREDRPAAVIYVGDPERPAAFDLTRVAELYGLSRAESRVAVLLASGYRLDQAAEMLGVAYETVRKHLKQIFSKTGTFRQAELVRIIVTGPAGLSI